MQNGQFLAGSGEDLVGGLQEMDVSRNTSRNIIPRFFIGMQKRPDVTDAETDEVTQNNGFREVEYVELLIPGDAKAAPVQLVDRNIRKQFAKHYQAFKEGRELPTEGTPVEYWLGANDARVHVLKSLHLRTVEQVAEMSDTVLNSVGMGARELRKRAQTFLDAQSNSKVADKLAAKDNELDELRRRLAALEAGGPVSSVDRDEEEIIIEGASLIPGEDDDAPFSRPAGASPVASDKAPRGAKADAKPKKKAAGRR